MTIGQANTIPAGEYLRTVLAQYGLESLTTWAMGALARGLSETQVLQEMRQTPEFMARFPAIALRQQAGLAPISPGEYVEYERRVAQIMRDAGMPPQFYDQPQDFTDLLVADRSAAEVASIVQDGYLRVRMAPPEVRDVFADWFGADGDAALAAFFLDPDRAKPALLRMADEAFVGGWGQRYDLDVTRDLATEITEVGRAGEAPQVFEQVAQQQPYFDETVTETQDLTTEQGIRAGLGLDADSTRQVKARREQRAAQFGGTVQSGTPGTAQDYQRRP